MRDDHNRLTIAAATIAAELHHAEATARKLTLSAKNASAVVLRAGSHAAGLSVISRFYQDVAVNTISLAHVINQTAIRLSSVTVSEWRTGAALQRIESARQKATEATGESIDVLHRKIEAQLIDIERQFSRHVASLGSDLNEIQRHTRAIDVVAVTSRIEAQRAGVFRSSLMQMADTIQEQTNQIKFHVNRSISLLNSALT